MKKQIGILFFACIVLTTGISIAYYNTSSFGYDNANVVTVYDGGVRIFDVDINFDKIKKDIERFENSIPDDFISI